MKNRNYVMSLYIGDTYLDVYGSIDKDEPSVGHIGGVEIDDVFIANTEINVLEMIHSLGWDKFNDLVQAAYQTKDHA
jgi:hypothetical protein